MTDIIVAQITVVLPNREAIRRGPMISVARFAKPLKKTKTYKIMVLDFDFEYNSNAYTLQAWVESSDAEGGIITKMANAEPFIGYDMGISDSGKQAANVINLWNGGVDPDAIKKISDASVNDSTMHLLSATYDGNMIVAGPRPTNYS